MSGRDDLIAKAKERAESPAIPSDWGYRVVLEEDEHFAGRWRGETVDEANENRRVYLFWDGDEQLCFSRHYAALGREIDREAPNIGDTIVIYRGADYVSAQGTGYSFGVSTAANDAPLPAVEEVAQVDDDELPF